MKHGDIDSDRRRRDEDSASKHYNVTDRSSIVDMRVLERTHATSRLRFRGSSRFRSLNYSFYKTAINLPPFGSIKRENVLSRNISVFEIRSLRTERVPRALARPLCDRRLFVRTFVSDNT